ncbi:ATP synthase F(0) complex subunit k, mitochondrial [Lissotriton helveticus]
MGGHDAGTHHQFTGIARYFNSYTIIGRRNCVLATYASIAALVLFFKLKPKKQPKAVTAP